MLNLMPSLAISNNFRIFDRTFNDEYINMYRFKAIITVRQGRVASEKSEEALRNYAERLLLSVSNPLHISCKQSFAYYHTDEEAEMRGIDYVELHLHLWRDCKRFRSVVSLSQLIRALSDLYDGTADTQVLCQIEEPDVSSCNSEPQHTSPGSDNLT